MRYTWRIIITLFITIFNGATIIYNGEFSLGKFLSFLASSALGWLIGYQVDKYRFSKGELGSTRTSLLNFSYALDSVADAIVILNERGQLEFINEAFAKMYGYSKEELLSLNWKNRYSDESSEQLMNTALPILQKDGHWRGETIGVRKDGTTFPQEISLSKMNESQRTVGLVRNITEQKKYEEFMKYVAEHNDLTNIPNRRRLLADLAMIKAESKDTSLLFIDLDHFKIVNDNLGHDVGDELLKNVAKRLSSFKNEFVKVYHNSGDEFIILILNANVDYINNLAFEIVKKIEETYKIKGNEVTITTSIGISRYPNDTNDVTELLKMADTAMYHAKIDGRNTFKFFNNELKLHLERKLFIETELRKAIKNNELFICYQPKLNLSNYKLEGIEALLRWKHPVIGFISPEEFIPIAEETGSIVDIGKWVIQEVLHQVRKWQDQNYPMVRVSLNVSQRQFRDEQLVHFIDSYLHTLNVDPKYLEIEMTESVMEDSELVIPKLMTLKEMGVGISIDDFGTGYSSLNILKDLPIDTLKIDKSFIRDLLDNPRDYLLVKTILQIGNILNLKVVAEGIETEEHLNHLLQLNCPIGQGFYFSKPINAAEFETQFFQKMVALTCR